MDTPGEMRAFVRAVELGGFSAAARDLDLTPSALSKLTTRLEDRLGVRLMNRTTRKLALTAEGEAYFASAKRILADIAEAEAEVTRFASHPKGLLRVNVGVAFGLHQLAPAIPRFLEKYPEVELEITVTDRLVDLVEEGADVAIRNGVLRDSSLVARKICDLHRVICASPSYLKRHGTPKTPQALLDHNCMTIAGAPQLRRWPFDVSGNIEYVEVRGNVTANNAESLLQLAANGVGIIRLTDVIVGDGIRAGWLTPILADCHHVEPVPLSAVYPHGKHRSPRVAAFVNFLVEHFADAPWRDGAEPRVSNETRARLSSASRRAG
ncbi:MAG: LysR family transcriptional regulator [Burkholderiales bacterium]|jgi:DNA-binding transcriptional LysR family regulator|nr:LysR family transcriptional regulator [Nitrosomonadaceae bacterium]